MRLVRHFCIIFLNVNFHLNSPIELYLLSQILARIDNDIHAEDDNLL